MVHCKPVNISYQFAVFIYIIIEVSSGKRSKREKFRIKGIQFACEFNCLQRLLIGLSGNSQDKGAEAFEAEAVRQFKRLFNALKRCAFSQCVQILLDSAFYSKLQIPATSALHCKQHFLINGINPCCCAPCNVEIAPFEFIAGFYYVLLVISEKLSPEFHFLNSVFLNVKFQLIRNFYRIARSDGAAGNFRAEYAVHGASP